MAPRGQTTRRHSFLPIGIKGFDRDGLVGFGFVWRTRVSGAWRAGMWYSQRVTRLRRNGWSNHEHGYLPSALSEEKTATVFRIRKEAIPGKRFPHFPIWR